MKIDEEEKNFILKALSQISTLYDFENTTEKEFFNSYGITKSRLKAVQSRLKIKLELEELGLL